MDPYAQEGGDPSTLPPPSRVPSTDPRELAARERRARRVATRSRIAEVVALVAAVAAAVQAYYTHQPHPRPGPCVEARP